MHLPIYSTFPATKSLVTGGSAQELSLVIKLTNSNVAL